MVVFDRSRRGHADLPAPTPLGHAGADGTRHATALRPAVMSRFRLRQTEQTSLVPDFPLTNKSFNLSYAGNDL